jgi:hypothetical protein
MWKRLAGLVTAMAIMASGCGINSKNSAPTTTVATQADTIACHDFGTEAIQSGSTPSSQAFEQLLSELESATNPDLRRDAASLRTAATDENSTLAKKATEGIAQTCYNLGLISRTGRPSM